jgi:hypothetical protein
MRGYFWRKKEKPGAYVFGPQEDWKNFAELD